MSYTAITRDDTDFSGDHHFRTANSVTLTAASDVRNRSARRTLKQLKSSGHR